MFNSAHRLTAIGIRLRDPSTLPEVSARLQRIAGAQVVTQTEMMGTFLNILGTVRTLLQSIGWVALCASVTGLMNTLLMSVAERAFEFSLFRAMGASRVQLLQMVALEGSVLTIAGILLGATGCFAFGVLAVDFARPHLPFFTQFTFRPAALGMALLIGFVIALLASLFPAFRAARSEPAQAMKGAD
jgi:putative ABC transport system permease protein